MISAAYLENILNDGDIRRHPAHPAHEPFVLYIMGDRDQYGPEKTKKAYGHWYQGEPELEGFAPCQEPRARKWFVSIPGAEHPGSKGQYHVWHFPGFNDILKTFLHRCLEEPSE